MLHVVLFHSILMYGGDMNMTCSVCRPNPRRNCRPSMSSPIHFLFVISSHLCCIVCSPFSPVGLHCVQKKNTHSHFLPHLHEWCV